jgi:7-cyano-7-deazaguanine reductase
VPKNKVMRFQGFRSICPVTSQPDWGNVYIHSGSDSIDSKKLIKLLKAYRNKGDFHEACIESIFISLRNDFKIDDLTVYGKFLRRGGIDINPIRSTSKKLIFKNFRDFSQ